MLWIRNEKTLWKVSFRRREITYVIPLLFFATRCNFAFRKCTNHQNPALRVFNGRKCTKNGAIYPQKRYTFTNKVGQYAISIPLIGSQSRHSHPIKSAFYATLLRFSWDIGIYSATTPLTAEKKNRMTIIIRFFFFSALESSALIHYPIWCTLIHIMH